MARLALPDRARSRAVLIGTSDFEHSELLPGLPAVRHNLTELSDALTNADTGILDWAHCVLIDTPDSPASFMGRLRKAANQAEDLLLVYYAGHGIRHHTKDDLYLTVRQTDPDGLDGTAVAFEWVRNAIEHSPARTRLLILDCCYSGMALGSMSGGTIDVRDVQVSGTCVITSSPRNKVSHSPPGERLTAFTGELISLLTHGPHVADEPLTVQGLYRGLVAAMANRSLPEPKMKAGDLSADLLLRRSPLRAEPLPPPPPPPPPEIPQPPIPEPAAARRAAPVGRLVLWAFVALLGDMTIGGLVGYSLGNHPRDLGVAGTLAIVTAIGIAILWLGTLGGKSPRKSRTVMTDLLDTLRATVWRWPTRVLATLAIISLALAVSGIFSRGSSSSVSSTISNLAVTVAMVLWLARFAFACLYEVFRRTRSG